MHRAGPWRWRSAGWLDGTLPDLRGHDRLVSTVRGRAGDLGNLHGTTKDGLDFQFEGEETADGSVRALVALQFRSTALEPVLRALLQPGDCFYDVGANIGLYATRAARLVATTGQVHAFEPAPYARSLLVRMLDLNTVSDVTTVVPLAVSSRSGPLPLRVPEAASGLAFTPAETEAGDLRVTATTVDDYAATHRPPDLIKVDVEGHERDVLAGALACLQRCHPVVVLEVIDSHLERAGSSPSDLQQILAGIGYEVWHLTPHGLVSPDVRRPPPSPNVVAIHRGETRGDRAFAALQHQRFRRNQTD